MRSLVLPLLFALSIAQGQVVKSPKAESEALMNAALPFAERMLKDHGEFLPYGQAMDKAGKFISIGTSDGKEKPPSKDLIQILKNGFREGANAGKYKATALVYDVRVSLPGTGTKSDAIAVSLNHQDSYATIVFFAYRIERGVVIMGEVFAQQEENYTFSHAR
jgi:hypothetical protein